MTTTFLSAPVFAKRKQSTKDKTKLEKLGPQPHHRPPTPSAMVISDAASCICSIGGSEAVSSGGSGGVAGWSSHSQSPGSRSSAPRGHTAARAQPTPRRGGGPEAGGATAARKYMMILPLVLLH